MARRLRGSNQHKTRWGPDLPVPDRGQAASGGPPARRRCGEVWGTRCRAWVGPPDWSHGNHPSEAMCQARARPPERLARLLLRLAQGPDPQVRPAAATHSACPPQVLEALAEDPDERVWTAVLADPKCPPALLEQGAQNPSWRVRRKVAQRPECPPELLEQLARDPHPLVRQAVAARPNCPLGVLEVLVRDPDERVQTAALANPNCPRRWRALGQL